MKFLRFEVVGVFPHSRSSKMIALWVYFAPVTLSKPIKSLVDSGEAQRRLEKKISKKVNIDLVALDPAAESSTVSRDNFCPALTSASKVNPNLCHPNFECLAPTGTNRHSWHMAACMSHLRPQAAKLQRFKYKKMR